MSLMASWSWFAHGGLALGSSRGDFGEYSCDFDTDSTGDIFSLITITVCDRSDYVSQSDQWSFVFLKYSDALSYRFDPLGAWIECVLLARKKIPFHLTIAQREILFSKFSIMHIPFIRQRVYFYAVSAFLSVFSLIMIFAGDIRLGIDLTGGTQAEYAYE